MTNERGDGSHPSTEDTDLPAENREREPGDSDQQFRALVDAVEEYAIFRLDSEGTVVSWNPGAERIKGYAAEEIIGRHFSTFYTDEDRAANVPENNLTGAVEQGSIEDEGWRVRADGSRFWANVTITAIRDDDGDLEGFAKVTRDMTDRKRAEEEHQLHLSVSRSLAEAASLEDGLLAVLEDVCHWTDWEVGQAWLVSDDGEAEKLPVSYVQSNDFQKFTDESSEFSFSPGEGIPGRVVETAKPVWFPDVTEVSEDIYPRTALAAEVGLKAGLGVPVLTDETVTVVLGFYVAESREVDEHMVEVVSSIAADLGGLVSRRQAEDELDRERQLLSEMMDAAPVGISIFSSDGDVQRVNEQALAIRGLPLDEDRFEADGRTFYDQEGNPIPLEEYPFLKVKETGEPIYDWTAQVELPNGRRKWLSVDAAPIKTDDGDIDRVVIIEEDLSELGEQYQAVMEAINDVIVTIDKDSVVRSVNPAVEDVFGYRQDELIGTSLTKLMPDELKDQHRAGMMQYLETGERTLDWDYLELPGLRADGTEIPLAVSFSEIRYRGERYFTGVLRDISERKEYQRQLEASNERLEQFAYAASHDLQEPLRMVSSYLRLIERRYADELDEDGREFIEFAVDGADRMRDMVEGLLEYSRVETRGDPFEPVDLDDVLAEVCDDLTIKIEETHADVTVESLPTVYGDARQLRQVFQNLLSNAITYSGDDPPDIHVGAERAGDEWVLSVSDEGIGIDPEDADRVFEIFQSLHTTEEGSGTGIGLALCKRIIERHDGEIWIDSEPGEGTTFSFTLPAARESNK
ncbi:PAS domain S-box protein [Natrinema sp. CBA1119]|uniref:PAS domain S-box protein n=1 Tax=Natrinema sp. CBA1119 TaxID=1608465 RepID=UPI00159BD0F3|nr:PAS domain S-box protein [Natrinema sp. CBA1119]